MTDRKMVRFLLVLLVLPLGLSMCSEERFRYPCQDPANWEKDICKLPLCDVNRTCPEHIFKGQRDPRLGPPKDDAKTTTNITPVASAPAVQGDKCGK